MEINRRQLLLGSMAASVAMGVADFARPTHSSAAPATAPGPSRLWYHAPASEWREALPIGNGRLGAMVFGGIDEERFQLNEETITSGGPHDPVNPEAAQALPDVRRLIFDGHIDEAQELAEDKLISTYHEMCYQPLGMLRIQPSGDGSTRDYRRELDLDRAIVTTEYARDGVSYRREAFVSPVRQAVVVRLTADRPGALDLDVYLDGPPAVADEPPWPAAPTESPVWSTAVDAGGDLVLTGRPSPLFGVDPAIRFVSRVRVLATEGARTDGDERISIRGGTDVVVLLTAATNHPVDDSASSHPDEVCLRQLNDAAQSPFGQLLSQHVQAHRNLYRRVSIDLGRTSAATLPTDERVARSDVLDDPAFAALYFQYSRYLLISSSRPGCQPANLQGIWNKDVEPPWQCNYTLNINAEMNYWTAEPAALPECTEPLVRLVRELAETGAETASRMYGARGWVAHHNTDLWRGTAPYDGPQGLWPCGGAWLCLHLWDRYDYARDRDYLADIYPLLRGACEFFLDTLQTHPDHGWLVTNPSNSPENSHHDGQKLCAGPTMDMQILRDLFAHTSEATSILGVDSEFRHELDHARARLAPHRIGRQGQLQEWLEDWDEDAPEPGHRHISHLYGLYPSGQIDVHKTPELAAAAKRSLELRTEGQEDDGWGVALRAVLWARLGEADHAHQILRSLFWPVRSNPNALNGTTYYQIDGNMGGPAAIIEMLLQSVDDEIRVLPALPSAWERGSVKGLRVRGGFAVDMSWNPRGLAAVTVTSQLGNRLRVRTAVPVKAPAGVGGVTRPEPNVIEFDTAPGGVYRLRPRG